MNLTSHKAIWPPICQVRNLSPPTFHNQALLFPLPKCTFRYSDFLRLDCHHLALTQTFVMVSYHISIFATHNPFSTHNHLVKVVSPSPFLQDLIGFPLTSPTPFLPWPTGLHLPASSFSLNSTFAGQCSRYIFYPKLNAYPILCLKCWPIHCTPDMLPGFLILQQLL